MRLKKEIESTLGVPVRIRTGAPGSLGVLVDGKQIFSLKEAGRLPAPEDILQLIRTAVA